jgi:hypothetical protein
LEKQTSSTRTLGDLLHGRTLEPIIPPQELKDEKSIIGSITDSVRAHVKKHGTFTELRFEGHGAPGGLGFGKDHVGINISHIIPSLQELQDELGIKIADKITFDGCNTFRTLSPEWVGYLRNASKNLGSELVGTEDYSAKSPLPGVESLPYLSFKDGEVGHFTKEPFNPIMHTAMSIVSPLIQIKKALINHTTYPNTWVMCHEGQTQAQGAACQERSARWDAKGVEVMHAAEQWLSAPFKDKPAPTKTAPKPER